MLLRTSEFIWLRYLQKSTCFSRIDIRIRWLCIWRVRSASSADRCFYTTDFISVHLCLDALFDNLNYWESHPSYCYWSVDIPLSQLRQPALSLMQQTGFCCSVFSLGHNQYQLCLEVIERWSKLHPWKKIAEGSYMQRSWRWCPFW